MASEFVDASCSQCAKAIRCVSQYRISRAAQGDLDDIWCYLNSFDTVPFYGIQPSFGLG